MKTPFHHNFSNFLTKRFMWLFFSLYKKCFEGTKFKYKGKEHEFLIDRYNMTICNERQVEIPIIRAELPQNILEVGNVLQHYGAGWDVVDKYEKGKGVINCDITRYNPNKKYDKIVSISTLEHLGEKTGHSKQKILKAIKHLKSLLNKGGKLIFTVPLGWNSDMDDLIHKNKLGVEMRFMKINKDGGWEEVDMSQIMEYGYNDCEYIDKMEYGYPFPFANAIMIGEYVK